MTLTIVCSDALLYDAACKAASAQGLTLSYMTPWEWEKNRRTGTLPGKTLLLEGLPWKLKPFSPMEEYEDLGFGVAIGKAGDFAVIRANPNKLLNISQYERFHCQLTQYSGRKTKPVCPSAHYLVILLLAVAMLLSWGLAPRLFVLDGLFLAGLLLERRQVKKQQFLYGTIGFFRKKPADII